MRRGGKALILATRNSLALAGGLFMALIVLVVLAAPLLPLKDPDLTDPVNRLKPLFADGALLGTDHLGRDQLARLVWGTRVSLAVGVVAALIAAVVGSAIGVVAGFAGGRTDNIIMRGIDMLMAFPYIMLALAIVAVLGPGLLNALFAVTIVNIPFFARNIRGATVAIVNREFVDAARLSGMTAGRIIWYEILPNLLPVIVIALSTTVGWMILETAGLSFLGLGSQPPQADLGSMLGEGRKLFINAPHVSVVPGAMIFLIVMSVNLLGDGVRDALDPRLSSGALTRPNAATTVARDGPPPPQDAPKDDVLLDVTGLRTKFRTGGRDHHAVGGVDLEVRPGESLGIVGESGSGKSVSALSLMRLVASPPGVITAGSIRFKGGGDTLAMDNEELRQIRGDRVSYVFQDPLSTLHPLHRVGDQLVEAVRSHQKVSHKEAWGQAVRMLELVRIPNAAARARSYPYELSGGMLQRVGIALALVNDPDLVVADEPTTALDVTVQAQVLDLIAGLRRDRGMALVFITHDFGVVAQLCDRVAVMYGGRIIEEGRTAEVLAAPRHPYTRELISCVPELGMGKRRLRAIPGMPPGMDALPAGCSFAPRCPRAAASCRQGEIGLVRDKDRAVRCLFPCVDVRHG